jgi:hypothetical protein
VPKASNVSPWYSNRVSVDLLLLLCQIERQFNRLLTYITSNTMLTQERGQNRQSGEYVTINMALPLGTYCANVGIPNSI